MDVVNIADGDFVAHQQQTHLILEWLRLREGVPYTVGRAKPYVGPPRPYYSIGPLYRQARPALLRLCDSLGIETQADATRSTLIDAIQRHRFTDAQRGLMNL